MTTRRTGAGLSMATILCTILAPTIAYGQQNSGGALQKLVATPQYQSNIARLFASLPSDVFQHCPALVSKGSSVTIVKPVSFAPDGYPVAGMWKQGFPVSGCGNDTTINFFFMAQPDEKITTLIAAPGDTHADLVLQRDAAQYVTIATHAKAPDCAAVHIRKTRYAGPLPAGPNRAVPWKEIWTTSACGSFYAVPLTFTPDAMGTTISAAPPTMGD